MGRNTRTGQQRCQPKVAVNWIAECGKSRAFGSDTRGGGDSGAFGHDARGEGSLCRSIPQNTKLSKKANCDYESATGRSRRSEPGYTFAGRSSTGASSIGMVMFL